MQKSGGLKIKNPLLMGRRFLFARKIN